MDKVSRTVVIIKRFFTTKFMGINSKNRLDFVDGLKGVAIILVVLGHIVDGYLNNGVDIDNNSVYWSIYNVIYSFHMPLFMMISGYLYEYAYFHEKKGKYKRLLAQTVNLLVVYVLFSILFSAIKLKFAGLIREKVTFFDIKHIFEYTIAPFWYLYILIVFYLCFIPIRKIPHYISLPLLTVLNLYSANWQKIGEKFEWYRLTYYALFFLFGIVIRNNKIRYRLNNEISKSIKLTMSVTLMIFAVILIVLNWNYKDAVFINEIPITSTVVATSFSMGIWILFRYYLFLSNDKGLIIKYLGKKTLEIYILHIIFVAFFRNVFYKVGTSNLVVSVLLNLVFSIVFSIIIANILIKLNVHGMVFKPFTVLFLGDKSIRKKNVKRLVACLIVCLYGMLAFLVISVVKVYTIGGGMDFNQIVLLEKVQNHNTIGVSSLITGLLIFLCMICIGRFLWVIHEKNIRERFLQKSMLACSIVGSILCCIIISAKTNFVNCISDTSFVEDNYVNPYECSFTQSESVKNLQNMLIIHVGEINLQNEVETYLGVPLHIGLFQDGVSVEQNVYQSLYGLTDILFEKYNYRIKAFSTFNPDSDIEVLSYLFESHNGDGSSLITDSTDEHTLGYIEKYIDQNSSALFFNSLYLKNYEELNLLLDWISKKNYYSQTCILLVDDIHETRKVINAKNNSANLNSVDEYEAFDLFPTIITWLGIDNPTHRLGLGYDLNSVSFIAGEQNLSSKYGKNALDKELCKKSKFLSRSYESDLSYLKANDNLLTRSFKFRINSDTTNKKIELVSNLYLDLDRYQGIDKIYAEVWQDGDKRQRQEFDLNSCPKRIVYQNFLLGGMLRNKKFYSNFSPDDWKKINQSDARVYELKAVFNDIDFDNDKINIHLYIKSDNGLIYPLYDVIEAEYRNYDNDLSHFLSDINYDDNILFISVKDDSSSRVSYLQRLILKGIGVDTDFKSLYRKGFCAVVNSGKVVEKDSYSVYLEGEVSYLDNNDGNKGEYSNIRYKMSSSGYDNGNVSSIIINNQEYSQNRKGMNIVVFDCKNGEVKESICFDTNGAIDYYHTNYCSK